MSPAFNKVNLDDSEWPAPRKALLEKLKFEESRKDSATLIWSDCQWTDNKADPKWLNELKRGQCINYFPDSSETFRKDTLTENINLYAEKYPWLFSDILPKSWNLPKQYKEFIAFLEDHQEEQAKQYFIIKENDEQRGVGIRVTDDPKGELTSASDVVVSKYIGNPLLVDGCKFDFRIHVLVASLEPFTVYVHHEGLMRMASVFYENPSKANRDNLYMHLTNLSLNKFNENSVHTGLSGDSFLPSDCEGKLLRSFDTFIAGVEKMKAKGDNRADIHKMLKQMDDLIGKVLIASYPDMKANYEKQFGKITTWGESHGQKNSASQCFQVLGFDIMFDEHYKPWFIEVNHNPDFVDDPKLASLIMRKTTVDTIEVMSEMNEVEFKRTEMTGDDCYDIVYEMPNGYRKVDIKGIRYQMEEAERVKKLELESKKGHLFEETSQDHRPISLVTDRNRRERRSRHADKIYRV